MRGSGADWTVVRSSFPVPEPQRGRPAGDGAGWRGGIPGRDVAEPFIDAEDIADVAVAALTEDGHAGRLYEVAGPRLLTFAEAVAEIAKAAGRQIRYL